MPIVIPTAATTYADATHTGGNGLLRKYILAQFRSDADHEWIRELRSLLVKDELKYEHFREVRPRLMGNRPLWRRIEAGLAQATVIIIDPEEIIGALESRLTRQGAEPGIDFSENDLHERCATALIGMTPIAYLPYDLVRVSPLSLLLPVTDLYSFAPSEIQNEIGTSLRQAKIFAARAHAMFDVAAADNTIASTRDIVRSPLAKVLLHEVVATQRMFDREAPGSLPVLNRAMNQIAEAMLNTAPLWQNGESTLRIQEVDSRAIDEIQAADISAGWARELAEIGDLKVIASKFGRVYLNGTLIDRLL